MKLGGYLNAVVEIIKNYDFSRKKLNHILNDWFISNRFAGVKDRFAILNIVYDILRQRLSIAWKMDSDNLLDIAYGSLLYNNLSIEQIRKSCISDKFSPPFLSLRSQYSWNNRNIKNAPLHIQANIEKWCIDYFKRTFKEKWINECCSLSLRPPFDIRVNTIKITSSKLKKRLSNFNIQAIPWYDQSIRFSALKGLEKHPNIYNNNFFKNGFFEIQDLGSQIVSYLCDPNQKMQVLDYCAGSGGKTIALAINMNNKGIIHAFDINQKRLSFIFERLNRSDIRNVHVHRNIDSLKYLYNNMDLVIVDVPCTSTGIWRRNPEKKWLLNKLTIEKKIKEQKNIISNASLFVKNKGKLIYITCSLLLEENDYQIQEFLNKNNNFNIIDMKSHWYNKILNIKNLKKKILYPLPYFSLYGILLTPYTTSTDGFFISILERKN